MRLVNICLVQHTQSKLNDKGYFNISKKIQYLTHLSWKLKTCSEFFWLPVNLSHFHLVLKNHWANFNQTWHKNPWVKGIGVFTNKDHSVLKNEKNLYFSLNQYDHRFCKCVYWLGLFLRSAVRPMGLLSFYAPLKKVLQLWVGLYVSQSVCQSVDQVLSGQYLLTPSHDQYQTWYRGCP